MKSKVVYFGKVKTLQVECPKCKEWQFDGDVCGECGVTFKQFTDIEVEPAEYRTDPGTWRDRVKLSVRNQVFERDDYTCQYCGIWCYDSWVNDEKSLTLDHTMPKAAGGNNDIENLTTSCKDCNALKTDLRFNSFNEARKYILSKKKHETI